MAPQPTWQGIPIEMKEYFVGYLDCKTRCHLRVCSKADRDLVDACPLTVRRVHLDLNSNELSIYQGGVSVEFHHKIVDKFCEFFEHRDFTVNRVSLKWNSVHDAAIDVVKNYLLSRIGTIRSIKTKNIHFNMNEISEQDLRRLFPVFDPNHLKSMYVEVKMSREGAEYLFGTDCWKNANSVVLAYYQDIKVDVFLHMDIFGAAINTLTAVNTWNVINAFIHKETLKPEVTGFSIDYKNGPTEEEIVAEFKVAPKKVVNPKHETNPSVPKYKYRFRTKTDGLFLVVVFNGERSHHGLHQLNGYICEEGQLMTPEPTWQGIPIEIKEYFVGYLDYKTRCRLRVCSKNDRDLVDACPLAVGLVRLDLNSNELGIYQIGASVEIHNNIVDNFCKIFEHRDFTVNSFSLCMNSVHDAAIDVVKNDFFSRMETIRTIKTKAINLFASAMFEQELRLLFPVFDPNHLESLRIYPKLSKEATEYLIGTDCWKNAKSAYTHECQNIRMDAFLHMDYFHVSVNILNVADTWNVIDTFINRKTLKPQANVFVISYENGPTEEQIVAKFKVLPKRVENPKHETNLFEPTYHYHFQTKTDGMLLVVVMNDGFGSHQFDGFICEEGQLEMPCSFSFS